MRYLALNEFSQLIVPFDQLSERQVALLQLHFASQLRVELLVAGSKRWRISSAGWVGTIPLGELTVLIRPKIPTQNLFSMLAVAYDLDLRLLDGTIQNDTIEGLLHRLATWLIDGVLDRIRHGLYRDYVQQEATLPYVRGRLRVREITHDLTRLPVAFAQFSADTPHNQLLLHTLALIRQTLTLPDTIHHKLNRAYRTLHTATSTRPFTGSDIETLTYDRLNADYRPLHALCRFFIDNAAPLPDAGERDMMPFLIDMAALFEKFVARWLEAHLPTRLSLAMQERSAVSGGQIQLAIDLVLKEERTGTVVCVLDTKWKSAEKPSNSDLYQIHFYADARNSPTAALIYPEPLTRPLNATVGDLQLRSLIFDVSAAVDHAGEQFMIQLMSLVAPRSQEAKEPRGTD